VVGGNGTELITSPEGKMRYRASLEKKLEHIKTIESGPLDMNKMWNDVKEDNSSW